MISRYFRRDSIIAAALFAVSLAIRIPAHARVLYSWDSVNFALGLERFNLQEHRPHPPGYILYMGLGRVFNFFIHDANTALVAISIIFGSAAVAGIFLLGRSIFDRQTGVVAAILLMFSPMGWLYSDVALSYSVELLLALAATWFLYQLFFYRRYAIFTAILIGLAAGFRQDILLFLGPFWFIGSFRVSRRTMLLSWGAIAIAILVWLVPLITLAGGITAYRQASSVQFSGGLSGASVFSSGLTGLWINLQQAWIAVIWLFGLAVAMIIYLPLFLASSSMRSDRRLLFLLILPLPAILFFLLYFFRQPYLLTNSTPLIVLMARILIQNSADLSDVAFSGAQKARFIMLGAVLVIIAGVNTGLFLNAVGIDAGIPLTGGTMGQVFGPYTVSGMLQENQKMDAIKDAVHRFDPADTVVFATFPVDWRHIMYYLPEYRAVLLNMDTGKGFSDEQNGVTGNSDGQVIPIPTRFKHAVFIELDPSTTKAMLRNVAGNTTPIPITSTDLPETGQVQVGSYTLQRQA